MDTKPLTNMDDIREYTEGFPVSIELTEVTEGYEGDKITLGKRWHIWAVNEGGYNSTAVDLVDLLKWLQFEYDDSVLREGNPDSISNLIEHLEMSCSGNIPPRGKSRDKK